MDFIKETFLKLTEYTIPHGKETTLEKYLPSGIQKDSIGNYYIKVGQSETLFTTHLDTYCKKYEKVKHVIDGNIIKTDGTTILGGDNKLGCTILLYMISKGIPGLYYFFLSEEPISPKGGRWGSLSALNSYENIFKEYKRCIAFDRKEMGSVVTRQLGRRCCSDEFADALVDQFDNAGMDYQRDHKAYYTDTATFLDTISECTNLSAGGYKEHYTSEWVDLGYTRQVAEAAIKIDWESLPVVREVEDIPSHKVSGFTGFKNRTVDISDLVHMLNQKYDLLWTNQKRYEAGKTEFMEFNAWFEDRDVKVSLDSGITFQQGTINKKFNTIKELDLYLNDLMGVPFDESQFGFDNQMNVNIYTDKDELITMSFPDYFEYFQTLNPGNTTYKVKGSKEQFTDYDEDVLTKQQLFKWMAQNELIE